MYTYAAMSFIIAAYPYGWPIFRRGPLWEFNSTIIMMLAAYLTQHTTPLRAFIIIVTLGVRFGPVGPQTFLRPISLGIALQLVQFIVMDACMNPAIFLYAL